LNRLVFYFGKWDFVNVVLGIRKTCHRLTQTFKKVFYPGAPEFIPGLNSGVRVSRLNVVLGIRKNW
jgi:hypothetical protein